MPGTAFEDLGDFAPPALQLLPLSGAIVAHVHHVVHDAAEGIDGIDGLALGTRKAEESVEEVGAALAGQLRDELGRVHSTAGAAKWPPRSPLFTPARPRRSGHHSHAPVNALGRPPRRHALDARAIVVTPVSMFGVRTPHVWGADTLLRRRTKPRRSRRLRGAR